MFKQTLYLCRSCIPERSLSLYTHLPSSFSSNPPALHRSSLLHCRYLSPTSPPPPPPPLTYPPLHLMAPPLCHSLPWLLLALLQTLILIFHPPILLPYSSHQCYQYYLCSNQIPHSSVAHNILSIFELSLYPPLQFSHLPPSHILSQQCLYSTQQFAYPL